MPSRRLARWLMLGATVLGLTLQAAVDEPVAIRLRQAVQLPMMNLKFDFGFTDSQDWAGEPDVPDPKAELERLKRRLKNELKDAEVRLEMARVAGQLPDAAEKTAYRTAAVDAWRKWAATAPEDLAVQTGLASALRVAKDFEEAERILRKVIANANAPWTAWYELTTVLGEIGVRPLYLGTDGKPGPLNGGPPASAAAMEESGRVLDEALAMADRLVNLAPAEARSWSRRARIRTNRELRELVRQPPGSGDENGRRMFAALFPAASVPDLEAAVRLQPKDTRLLMTLTFHRLGSALYEVMPAAREGSAGNPFERLPESQQAAPRESVAQFERLGAENDPALAAAAWEGQAILRMVMGDQIGSGKSALRAVRLDPARNGAFELCLASAVSREKPDWKLAEEVVRERLKVSSDARIRYALVKILNESDQPVPALAAAHEAIKEIPGVALLEIAHVALHVRAGDYPGGSEQASLEKVGKALEALPDGEDKMLLSRNFFITGAVITALQNDPAGARKMLKKYRENVPDDNYAKAVDDLVKKMN